MWLQNKSDVDSSNDEFMTALREYVTKAREMNLSEMEIEDRLREKGYPEDIIEKVFETDPKPKRIEHGEQTEEEKYSKPKPPKLTPEQEGEIKMVHETAERIRKEMARVVIGQADVINSLIRSLLCDGHVLLEGIPGIAKTLAIKSLAKVTGCESKRIQFTVDLLPSDIVGITTYTPEKGFEIVKGPIFTNFIIADEINRSPPKTQSALLEAMQERQVTIGKSTFDLPEPFFVMANQNPLETSGVYPLPEAQVDRFLFKVFMYYPKIEEEDIIMEKNTTIRKFEDIKLKAVTSPQDIIKMQRLVKKVYLSAKIREYILKIVEMTRTKDLELGQYIEWGASPRATIGLFIASKANALMNGRNYVLPEDVRTVAYDILRHRIILSYKARAERVNSDKVIKEILEKVKAP